MRAEQAAFRASIAVALAVSLYGVSFGALAVASGLDVWQTCVLSLLMFSGGSQFALIGVLASGGASAGFAAVLGAALLGTRNGLYAMRMSPIVGGPWWRKLLAAHRTLVLSRAPAQIVGEHAITIPRPRDIRGIMTHPDFAALYQRIRVQVQ